MRKFLKYVFVIAFMANIGVFCVGMVLDELHIMVLPILSMPLCMWGIELYSDD